MQSLLLLLAPALFAASIYMILGRIIRLTDGEPCSIIRARWLTKVFVAGDVFSFFVQSAGIIFPRRRLLLPADNLLGGGMLAKAKDESGFKLGQNIITIGLGIQVLFFGFFIIVAGIFHYRIRLCPTTRSIGLDVPWERQLIILYIASVFIMVRSVFRIIEYVMGYDGFLLDHEYFLYIFDGVLMFLTMIVFNIWHPSKIISKEKLSALDSNASAHDLENQQIHAPAQR
jgi:hypothetical protein